MKYIATLLLFISSVAFAGDWVQFGQTYTKTLENGSTWTYHTEYSPSSVVRNGDLVTFTFETVDTDSTKVFVDELNCATRQYRIAIAGGTFSELRNILPGTMGVDVVATFCK